MRQPSVMPHRLNNNDGDDDNGSDDIASRQQAQRITGFSLLTKMYWNLLGGDTRLAVLGRDVKYISRSFPMSHLLYSFQDGCFHLFYAYLFAALNIKYPPFLAARSPSYDPTSGCTLSFHNTSREHHLARKKTKINPKGS
jgi:hypothetical protein